MLVKERMTPNPITISPDTSVPDALTLMRERKVRRFPVLDKGKLVGIVSEKDLLHASPSPATTLSVYEIRELLAKLKVSAVMCRQVVTVPEDTPLEDAARMMIDHRISSLPVMRAKALVGIITESDLFKSLVEQMGGRRKGVRLTVLAPGARGTLAKITEAIFEAGGDIVGLGSREMTGAAGQTWEVTFKVQGVPAEKLVKAVRPAVLEVLDVRES